ncbi:hypothetical protein Pcinc_023475 [Petrolisthes cinctipes]|uniref:Uncharacterized protein n=1 Tax=Petrolisthes cinctipes TaxID=88211 RepID=A0AAE1KFR2_PETCI|nr:hypothetical protein Pcinc_023475 [Petrolisthes cinctipes]
MKDHTGYNWEDNIGGVWEELSPRHLEHRPPLPTAITLHRLVPRPIPHDNTPLYKASVPSYKHVTPEELEAAQIRAQHDLLFARLQQQSEATQQQQRQQQPSSPPPVQEVKKPTTTTTTTHHHHHHHHQSNVQSTNKTKNKNVVVSDKISTRPKPRPHLTTRQGTGEESMRLRQLSKFVDQISSSLAHLDKIFKQECLPKDFVMPLDNDVKQKRWEEFRRSTRRSLFSLKQEICVLEKTTQQPDDRHNNKYLRSLAVSARSLLRLLLALQTHTDKAASGEQGQQIFDELVILVQRLFPLVSGVGVRIPKLTLKLYEKNNEGVSEPSDGDGGGGSERDNNRYSDVSDIDSSVLATLTHSYVRDRIALLAHHHQAARKRKWKKGKAVRPGPTILHHWKRVSGNGGVSRESPRHRTGGNPIQQQQQLQLPSSSPISSHLQPHTQEGLNNERKKRNKQGIRRHHNNKSKEDHKPPRPRENLIRSSPDAELRVMDGHELVENTAEAVVERLHSLLNNKERKEGEADARKSDKTRPSDKHHSQPTPDFPYITAQVRLMLQRVCRIEEDRKEALILVESLSGNTEEENNADDHKLTSTIKKAQEVIASLNTGDKLTYSTHSGQGVSGGKSGTNYLKAAGSNSNNHLHHSQRAEETVSQNHPKFFRFREAEQENIGGVVDENIMSFSAESRPPPAAAMMSVADLVQKQKEEFWASLVERGYLKPDTTMILQEGEDQDDIDILLQMVACTSGKDTDIEKHDRKEQLNASSKLIAAPNINPSSSKLRRSEGNDGGGSCIVKENKETQVSSSFQMDESKVSTSSSSSTNVHSVMPSESYSSDGVVVESHSRITNKSNVSKVSSSGDDVRSGGVVLSHVPTESSTTVISDGQSESFPSYDGASNS